MEGLTLQIRSVRQYVQCRNLEIKTDPEVPLGKVEGLMM